MLRDDAAKQDVWFSLHRSYVTQAQTAPKVVFFGDSLTYDWNNDGWTVWQNEYARHGAANFGVGGDLTADVAWRVEHGELGGAAPQLIVLLIGTNDLGTGSSVAETIEGIRGCVRAMRKQAPASKILLLGILPRGAGGAHAPMRQAVTEVNTAIAKLADHRHVHFLDIGNAFLNSDGSVRDELFQWDRLHLGPLGYRAWASAMQPTFERLLKG